jgi:hypothetical protein
LLSELRSLPTGRVGTTGDVENLGRRARLERELRRRALLDGSRRSRPQRPLPASTLLDLLGDRWMVTWVVVEGRVVALTAGGGRFHRLDLGPFEPLLGLLRQAARRHGVSGTRRRDEVVAQIDETMLRPVVRRLGDRSLVVVPSAELLSVPWASLPTLAPRPFVVAPSATLWARAEQRASESVAGGRRRVLAVAGPGLVHAEDDVRAAAGHHRRPTVLTPDRSQVGRTLAALSEADVVHIAAHGDFRPDNPLLSSLELADGPLTAYDLEVAGPLPPVWVLAACEGGRLSEQRAGQVMGFASVLLQFGAASVVAAAGPVLDASMPAISAAIHAHLARGLEPSEALAVLRREAVDEVQLAEASAFVSLGGR